MSNEHSNTKILVFMAIVSIVCASLLSIITTILHKPQQQAIELDRAKHLLIATNILDHKGHFQILQPDSTYTPAQCNSKSLVPTKHKIKASSKEIFTIANTYIKPYFIDPDGNLIKAKDTNINLKEYLQDHWKDGYAFQKYKLIYYINTEGIKGYIIPINGYGLWDKIYGYLAIKTDGDTIIGTTWYDQKETPGLGANIEEAEWLELFPGKKIFHNDTLGITIVKGKVSDIYGTNNPKAECAVDGISGATLTCQGVTKAYKNSLEQYRTFLIRLSQGEEQ